MCEGISCIATSVFGVPLFFKLWYLLVVSNFVVVGQHNDKSHLEGSR